MFDVFYVGKKPNLFSFEKSANDLDDAAAQCQTGYYWCIYGENDYSNFDFDFVPPPWQKDHVHVWPTQWNQYGGAYLAHVDSVKERKWQFHNTIVPIKADDTAFEKLHTVEQFNYSWRPHPFDPPYIYVFGNNWYPAEKMPTVEYHVPGATERKFMAEPFAQLPERHDNKWNTLVDCEWDYSWVPDPGDPPYIYVFGNQHWPANIMPTVEYCVPGATEKKFMDYPQAKLLPCADNWTIPDYIDPASVDTSWVPDPGDPAYIFHFPSQWQAASGVTYTSPGATEIKLSEGICVKSIPVMLHWSIPEEVNKETVDFSWHPDARDQAYIYHFGTEYQQSVGLTYTLPGSSEIKFAGPVPTPGQQTITVTDVLPIFFIDKGNPTAQARYDYLLTTYKDITKVRYVNSMMDTIARCITRVKTTKFWVISSEYDYSGFDFHWHAEPWQHYMTHVFPSQHNKWSDTFLINRYEFERHAQWAKGLEDFPNLNFVSNQSVVKPENIYNMYYVDHGNTESKPQYDLLKKDFPDLVSTRFANTYLDTFKRIMFNADTEYVWILNSVCNYDFFDFTWQPEPWQKEMIHCFANGTDARKNGAELRGDTFYIHVKSFKAQMVELELLDWFNVINYVVDQRVERWPIPVAEYVGDDLITAIKNHNFTSPYALFDNTGVYRNIGNVNTCLWTEKDRTARSLSTDKSMSLIPRDVKKYLKTQVYDYPYLNNLLDAGRKISQPLDIVYISNGEPDAEHYYNHLVDTVYGNPLRNSSGRIKRVQNVDGRVAAYQAAARASDSNWFFAVFAKLEVDANFNWEWQPDYWQGPKHYIFNARNPVNGLEYGHMGMIAYNKSLVLANNAPGIDFTLSQSHESVPILSGVAHYNQDAWTTWRTAFREVLKLRMFMDTQPTLETEHRLDVWRTKGEGKYAGFSINGAKDAIAYYDEVAGDPAKLQLSFDWKWLREYYDNKYNNEST